MRRKILYFFSLGISSCSIFLFQNCAGSFEAASEGSSYFIPCDAADCTHHDLTLGSTQGACVFNGRIVANGSSVDAFLSSTGPTCGSEIRKCDNGFLTGSFAFSSCQSSVTSEKSCIFDGKTVPSGSMISGFLLSSVPSGQSCDGANREVRTCANGVLKGSFKFASCNTNESACQFDGKTVVNSAAVKAFLNPTSLPGQQCVSESRTCKGGLLSGTYKYPTCTVNSSSSCLFDGKTIPHLGSVDAFASSSVPFGKACAPQLRTCNNGILSGSYTYASCASGQPKACLFNGETIPHGGNTSAYFSSSVAFGQNCLAQTRSCNDGALSGTALYASCAVGQPQSCLFDGMTVNHGSSVYAFDTSTVAFGMACTPKSRVCNNGNLSGSAPFGTCSVGQPTSCLFNGKTVVHGSSVKAYWQPVVTSTSVCQLEDRICQNGQLSGSATYSECSVEAPQSCSFGGLEVADGATVTGYQNYQVPHGSTCVRQTRLCTNGFFSGSLDFFESCKVETGVWVQQNGLQYGYAPGDIRCPNNQAPVGPCNMRGPSNMYGTNYCKLNEGTNSSPRLREIKCVESLPRSCVWEGKTIPNLGYIARGPQGLVGNGRYWWDVLQCLDGQFANGGKTSLAGSASPNPGMVRVSTLPPLVCSGIDGIWAHGETRNKIAVFSSARRCEALPVTCLSGELVSKYFYGQWDGGKNQPTSTESRCPY